MEKQIRALIIDDEERAITTLKLLVEECCDNVEIIDCISNPLKAKAVIEQTRPDLLFLDIEMPGLNGFDLLDSIDEKTFSVIFTTAYDEFAINAFKVNAVDYLLKPVERKDLLRAVDKVYTNLTNNNKQNINNQISESIKMALFNKIAFPSVNGTEYIETDHIIRFQSEGSYSKAFLTGGNNILISKNLKSLENQLEQKGFFRIHKLHLINLRHLRNFSKQKDGGEVEMLDKSKLKLSRTRREAFIKLIETYIS